MLSELEVFDEPNVDIAPFFSCDGLEPWLFHTFDIYIIIKMSNTFDIVKSYTPPLYI